jgi:hypothetical protein
LSRRCCSISAGEVAGANEVVCASIEHKLGIHGSPTAVLAFGDKEGAFGELVGEPNRGLEYMFAMMNHARLNVGLQGLAISERAYQQALAYARDRVQGKPIGFTGEGKPAIVHHPDVWRMLVHMKARIEAMRGLLYEVAAAHDVAHAHPDEAARAAAQRKVDLLTPIAKGWCTENSIDIASLGLQVHGGMGYIEETGAAQHWRDARITTIYEGTTGIQANDLIGRKLLRDKGEALTEYLDAITTEGSELLASTPELQNIGESLLAAAGHARDARAWILGASANDPRLPYAAAVPFLNLMGLVVGAYVLGRAAKAAAGKTDADGFYASKIALAKFYAAHILPQAESHWLSIRDGSQPLFEISETHL